MLGRIHDMTGTAVRSPFGSRPLLSIRARVCDFVLSNRSQAGAISTPMLIIILVAPLVILGGLAFVFIIAFVNRVSRVTAELESKPKPTVCPACGHKLIEIRKFCAECGASIWLPEAEPATETDVSPEEPE